MSDLEKGRVLSTPKDELTLESPVSSEANSNDIEKTDGNGASESNVQSNLQLVDWDGPDDPEFPQNL